MTFNCQVCNYTTEKKLKFCPMCGWKPEKQSRTIEYEKILSKVTEFIRRSLLLSGATLITIVVLIQIVNSPDDYTVEVPAKVFFAMFLVVFLCITQILMWRSP
ncbi:hypothetical protein DRP07_00650 [Archaeoglobales archaeon]|nr:MAG: hypothetical protein DRP07_00650 [Archaeoglobales archaeon]